MAETETRDLVEEVEVCRLSDGKLSVRVGGEEVCLLPAKKTCTLEQLQMAFEKVVERATAEIDADEIESEEW